MHVRTCPLKTALWPQGGCVERPPRTSGTEGTEGTDFCTSITESFCMPNSRIKPNTIPEAYVREGESVAPRLRVKNQCY